MTRVGRCALRLLLPLAPLWVLGLSLAAWPVPRVLAQTCGMCGDVNGDGNVDVVDALFIAQTTVDLRTGLACAALSDVGADNVGDVRGDKTVDIIDALFIAQFAVGTRPIPCFRITAPPRFKIFPRSPTTVSGIVTGAATVVCNGKPAPIAGGAFGASIPLQEGTTVMTCVAESVEGTVLTSTDSVILDSAAPRVIIDSPTDGSTVDNTPIVVTGMVNDIVVGTVNGEQAQIICNGVEGQLSNRAFVVAGVALTKEGPNVIRCAATDQAENVGRASVTVHRDTRIRARISMLSGDLQGGPIGTTLPDPLVVSLTADDGTPIAGKTIIFKVVQNDGTVSGGDMSGRSVAVETNANGRAQVSFTLGSRAGAGNNQVQVTAAGIDGEVLFCATATPSGPAGIVVDSGNNQRGAVAQPLPRLFIAIVIDQGGNRLSDVPVTFTVKAGGGSFTGQPNVTVNTDSDGRAYAILTLGSQTGFDNNVVEASFPGNPGAPAVFVASGQTAGDPADTRVSGVVLDNTDAPVPGATILIAGTTLSTISDDQGQFLINGAPVGHAFLLVDGSTVQKPGTWPNLEFEMVLVAGQNNTIGRGSIYLLPLEIPGGEPEGNKLCVDETHGGTITVDEVPGFALTILPGSATFPNGSRVGCVTVTPVHPDKAPMSPNFGQQPRFIVTIQPAGTVFEPPAPLTLPNTDGLPPAQKTDMYSFDHDLGQFVSIGPGTVSDDGTVVRADPGVGVVKGGWHCGGNPTGIGTCEHECDDGNDCTNDKLVGNSCQSTAVADGASCRLAKGSPADGTCKAGTCVCAVPTNFHQTSALASGGVLTFRYAWESSTGDPADLSNCLVDERVDYPGGNPFCWPSPPWTNCSHNPTSPPGVLATDAVARDVHSSEPFTKPYRVDSFSATQRYRYQCLCDNNGAPIVLLGPITITRSVAQNPDGTFRHTITKSGLTASIDPMP